MKRLTIWLALTALVAMLASCGRPQVPSGARPQSASEAQAAIREFTKQRQEAYRLLTPDQQALADQGRLVFNGDSWASAPTRVGWPFPLDGSAFLGTQAAMTEYQCPLEANPSSADHGVFFLTATEPGTHYMAATLAVPALFDTQVGAGEEVYAMFSGWPARDSQWSFDAGLTATPPGGWSLFSNIAHPDPAAPTGASATWYSQAYRLWNTVDRNGLMFVELSATVVADNEFEFVATALDDTVWIPSTEFSHAAADPNYTPDPQLYRSSISLGGVDGSGHVVGFAQNSSDNVLSVQFNLGKNDTDPTVGTKLPYSLIYNLKAGANQGSATPINIFDDPRTDSLSYAFQVLCPKLYPGDAYWLDSGGSIEDGSSAADNPDGAAAVTIDILRPDVHTPPPCNDVPIFPMGIPDLPPSYFGVHCGPHAAIYYQRNAVSNMGRPFSTMLGLENNGDATLHYEVSVNGGAVGLSTNAPTSGAVDPGRGTEIPLAGTCPSAVDWDTSGTVTITSDDPDSPLGPVPITVLCYQLEVSGNATTYVDGQPVSGSASVVNPGQTLLLDGRVTNVYDSTLDESVGWAIATGPGTISIGQGPGGEPATYYTAPTAGYADGAPFTLRVHSIAQPDVTYDIDSHLNTLTLLACEGDAGGCSVGNLEYSYSVGPGQTKDISITSNDFSGQGATLEVTSGQGALSSTREHIPNGTAWSAPTVDIVHFTAPTLPCYNSGETQTHATTTVLATSNSDPQAAETITFNTIGLVCQ